MLRRRRRAIAITLAAVLSAVPLRALADDEVTSPPPPPPRHFRTPPVCTVGDATLELPPGYYLAESAFTKLDLELRRAQDAETRLTAEGNVLRRYAEAGNLGWRGAAVLASTAFVAGAAAAYYALR
jgi:hypothetical protein